MANNLDDEHEVIPLTIGMGFGAAFLYGGMSIIKGGGFPKGGRLWFLKMVLQMNIFLRAGSFPSIRN